MLVCQYVSWSMKFGTTIMSKFYFVLYFGSKDLQIYYIC